MKAWCQGGRAGGRRSPGGGTCTSVSAAASRPGRRAGPRARGALRKWRARRAGGAPRAVGAGGGADTCARVHAPLPGRPQVEGLGGGGPPHRQSPTSTKDSTQKNLVSWETSYPQPWTVDLKGQALKPRWCPKRGAERQNPRRAVPSQPSSSKQFPIQLALPRPGNQGRTFTISDKPDV